MNSPSERSIAALMGDAVSQLSKLITNEFELARAEIAEKVSRAVKGGAVVGAGIAVMLPAIIILLMAAAKGLVAAGLSEAVAYLIVGLVTAGIGALAIFIGMKQMTPEALMPTRTMDELKRDRDAAKEMMR